MPQPCNLKLTENKNFWWNIYGAFHYSVAEQTSFLTAYITWFRTIKGLSPILTEGITNGI